MREPLQLSHHTNVATNERGQAVTGKRTRGQERRAGGGRSATDGLLRQCELPHTGALDADKLLHEGLQILIALARIRTLHTTLFIEDHLLFDPNLQAALVEPHRRARCLFPFVITAADADVPAVMPGLRRNRRCLRCLQHLLNHTPYHWECRVPFAAGREHTVFHHAPELGSPVAHVFLADVDELKIGDLPFHGRSRVIGVFLMASDFELFIDGSQGKKLKCIFVASMFHHHITKLRIVTSDDGDAAASTTQLFRVLQCGGNVDVGVDELQVLVLHELHPAGPIMVKAHAQAKTHRSVNEASSCTWLGERNHWDSRSTCLAGDGHVPCFLL
mmetsp:Transcript_6400/g.15178  ORF Transcript_6400/g.15178 Transcript_6400/m.15178 type:complete len:331 (-) Transcript_6400:7-999(-)